MSYAIRFIAVLVLFAAGYFAPDVIRSLWQPDIPTEPEEYCQLSSQPCKQSQITITLSHDISRPLQPNAIEINWPGAGDTQLLMTLRGKEMNMGTLKFMFSPGKDGQFRGNIILPVCTGNAMTWQGEITDGHERVYTSIRMER